MKDYHELYLKCDVLLLADAFEKFRNNKFIKKSWIMSKSFLSALALSWNAMLNITKVEHELISGADMYLFFEKGMTGGISKKYSKGNDKYLKSYNPKQEAKHIIYLDANNLYGYAISKFLPTSGFKWIDPKEFTLNKYTSSSTKGFVLKVDLKCPKELCKLHNNYPLAPDKIESEREMPSSYRLKIPKFYDIPIGNVKKLVPNFFDKEKYMLHYETLQLCLNLGLKLKKVDRLLEINESQWLKLYIEFNTQKRIETEKTMETKMKKNCTN